jgi:hypothetical protein
LALQSWHEVWKQAPTASREPPAGMDLAASHLEQAWVEQQRSQTLARWGLPL